MSQLNCCQSCGLDLLDYSELPQLLIAYVQNEAAKVSLVIQQYYPGLWSLLNYMYTPNKY